MTKSQSIHDTFEQCLDLVLSGASIDECVRRFPDHEGKLRELLETAAAVRKAVAVQPSADFRGRARQQLEATFRKQAAMPKRTGFRWDWQPRWAVATAASLVVLVAGSGVVLAANSAMPDHALYAVKQATEEARLALASSPTAKATVYTALADRRVSEIVYLAAKGESAQLSEVTRELSSDLDRMTDLLGGASQDGQDAVRYEAATDKSAPLAVPATIPPPTTAVPASVPTPGEGIAGATSTASAPEASFFLSVPQQAGREVGTQIEVAVPAGSSSTDLERAKLRARVLYQAAKHAARLRAALANVPDEARPALLQAIAASETGYEKALQSLETHP